MSGEIKVNTMDDIDAGILNAAEVKAIATGNPHIKRKMELETEIARIGVLSKEYQANRYNLQDKVIKEYPQKIINLENQISKSHEDIATRNTANAGTITLGKKTYDDKKEAGQLILSTSKLEKYIDKEIGQYRGFKIVPLSKYSLEDYNKINLVGKTTHTVSLGDSPTGVFTRMDNVLDNIEKSIEEATSTLQNTKAQIQTATKQLEQPFAYEDELKNNQKELDHINKELGIGEETVNNLIDEIEEDILGETFIETTIEEEGMEL